MNIILKILYFVFFGLIGLLFIRWLFYPASTYLEIESFGVFTFVQFVATLYGILTAFVIYVVWDKYNKIKDVSEEETDNLSELYYLVTYLENPKYNRSFKLSITNYAESVINDGWSKLSKGEKSKPANTALHNIYRDIRSLKSDRRRFPIIFGQIVEKFEHVSDLRTERINKCTEHLPKLLKTLLIFEAFILYLGMTLLPFTNIFLSAFITTITITLVVLTTTVISDLDHPLEPGDWQITPKPFKKLIEELSERR